MSTTPPPLFALIVEDNPEDAELVVRGLRRAGYDVHWRCVETEDDFCEAIYEKPDIILSDYNLPKFDVTRGLRILEERRLDIPFVLISGVVGEEMAVAAIREGAEDYLLKDRLGRLGTAVRQAIERCQMRSRKAQAESALRESEERFRQVVENIQEVFWMTDPATGKLLFISSVYERVWGRKRADLYADPEVWVRSVHPDDRERIQRAMLLKLRAGALSEEYRIVRPDGTVRRILARAFPVYDDFGELHRVVGVATDITERWELEEQLRQAQKMEALGQLAGGVAHDFNNLLTIVQGYTALLLQRAIDPVEAAQEISLAVERASGLTRQLLTFSRKQVMQQLDIELNTIVADITKMLQRTLTESIKLSVRITPGLPLIRADKSMMEQILMNLALNARDSMPEGGILTITTSAGNINPTEVRGYPDARPGPAVCLTVRDTGCGIPPENLQRIFEPFFTTKDVSKGTGLGLPNVDGIVRQHHGSIRVFSEVGAGTSIQILLPTAVTTTTPAAARKSGAIAPIGGKETIMLVEDEAPLRLIIRMALSRIGYNIIEAGSGQEAANMLQTGNHKLDLVVTDMVMPDGMTGRDLARHLETTHPALPVIFTSGYHAEFTGAADLKEGVNFLQKPYSPQKLARVIRNCLDEVKASSPVPEENASAGR
ncbi:MAG: response regulator [Candidatus Methylacidiphilales bacterium]|nr:response regulator [Candidatus Methylacidiphilales bacterium]